MPPTGHYSVVSAVPFLLQRDLTEGRWRLELRKVGRRWTVMALASAMAVGACASPAPNLPTHADPIDPVVALAIGPSSALSGPVLDERGCFYVGSSDPTTREVPIWPPGYTYDQGAILAPGGKPVVVVGQAVTPAGGLYQSADYEAVSKFIVGDVPSWCRQGQYWFVSAVVP